LSQGLVRMRALALGRLVRIAIALALAAPLMPSAQAASAIQVSGAYALADAKSPRLGYVYMTISAAKGVSDQLVGGKSPVANTVLLVDSGHGKTHAKAGDAARLDVNGHAPLVLQPHGPHFVLRGMATPLHAGAKIRVVLEFAHAAPVEVSADVLRKQPAVGAPQLPKGIKID
jgi:copper(I)-binding protein